VKYSNRETPTRGVSSLLCTECFCVKIIEFTGDIEKAKMCAFVMRGVVLQRKGMQGSVTIKVAVDYVSNFDVD
jgi:hypothetical protein